MEVRAGQLIYGNVSAAESPQRRGGFQTLFYTRDALNEDEVRNLESRWFYYGLKDYNWAKRVFCVSNTGKYILAQVVPIQEPDEYGRYGRSLAHAFIFSPEEFEKAGCNPFALFHSAPFVTTIEEALRRGNHSNQDIPFVSWAVPEAQNDSKLMKQWSTDDRTQMALLALRAQKMAEERRMAAFIGNPEQVEDALRVATLAVPAPLIKHCTFDTYFYRGNRATTYYWAVGSPEPLSDACCLIDAEKRKVTCKVAQEPKSLYEQWVRNRIRNNELELLQSQKEYAFALCEWLEEQPVDETFIDDAPPDVVKQVFSLGEQHVNARLEESLKKQLEPNLAQRCSKSLSQLWNAQQILHEVRKGISPEVLLDTLEQAYRESNYSKPPRAELEELARLLQRHYHRRLRFLYLCWSTQTPRLQGILEGMPKDEYRETVEIALRHSLTKPHHLIVHGKIDTLLDAYQAVTPATTKPSQMFIQTLIENSSMDVIERVRQFIREVLPESDIDKLFGKYKANPSSRSKKLFNFFFRRSNEQ